MNSFAKIPWKELPSPSASMARTSCLALKNPPSTEFNHSVKRTGIDLSFNLFSVASVVPPMTSGNAARQRSVFFQPAAIFQKNSYDENSSHGIAFEL
mmetsp:Transcript_12338/g.28951  ORF Transcript_12338/g.28951 Transcript_12338/m.28951 type:complete len:97 (+) Transcript_12338:1273-1563(+)